MNQTLLRRSIAFCLLPSFLAITGCQEGPPAFTEQLTGQYVVNFSEGDGVAASSEDQYSVDELLGEENASEAIMEEEAQEADAGRGRKNKELIPIDGSDSDRIASFQDAGDYDPGAAEEPKSTPKAEKAEASRPLKELAQVDSRSLAQACAKAFKGKAKSIKTVDGLSAAQTLQIAPDTVLAVKITGNQEKVVLDLAASDREIAGICVMIAGNQGQFTLNSSVSMKQFTYVARGNLSQGRVKLSDGASLGATQLDLSGNQPTLSLSGVAKSICDAAKISGNGASVTCEP